MNIYIEQIKSIALPNKYTKWYIELCESRLSRGLDRDSIKKQFGYVESHHILPEDFELGGEIDKENRVFLTGREHFISHWLLKYAFETTKYEYSSQSAFCGMGGNKGKRRLSARQIGRIRKENAERPVSDEIKLKISLGKRGKKQNPEHAARSASIWVGRKHSEETKLKMSKNRGNRVYGPVSEETRLKMSIARKDKPKSPKHRAAMSKAQTGKTKSKETRDKISAANERTYSGEAGLLRKLKASETSKRKWKERKTDINYS